MALDSKKQLALTITIFITLLIGIVLLSTVADEVYNLDALGNSTNESVTQVNDTFVELEHKYVHTFYVLNSYNGTVVPTADYTVKDKEGKINISSRLAEDGWGENITFYAYYMYYPNALGFDSSNSAALTLTKLLTLFFALGILAVGLMFIFPGFRDFFE